MSALGTITSEDVSPRELPGFWQSNLLRMCGRLGAETQVDRTFSGKIEHALIGDVKVAKITASRHGVVRKPISPARWRQLFEGRSSTSRAQRFRTRESSGQSLPPGMVHLRCHAALPVKAPEDTETLLALLPHDGVTTPRISVEDLFVRPRIFYPCLFSNPNHPAPDFFQRCWDCRTLYSRDCDGKRLTRADYEWLSSLESASVGLARTRSAEEPGTRRLFELLNKHLNALRRLKCGVVSPRRLQPARTVAFWEAQVSRIQQKH